MNPVDSRSILRLDGVADCALEGRLAAPAYKASRLMRVTRPRAGVRLGPGPGAEQADELVFGETFRVLEIRGEAAFGQAARDGYVGWTDVLALAEGEGAPTHRVCALSTLSFAEPSLRAPVVHRLPMNALANAGEVQGRFIRLEGSGWAPLGHLAPIGTFSADPVKTALMFLNAPYLWGGRTVEGVDCSGLVQQALYACGRACPRDSDQQSALGRALGVGPDLKGLARGDLVFWPGHVGLMIDEVTLLHANAHAMGVALEDVREAVARIEAAGSGRPCGVRRL